MFGGANQKIIGACVIGVALVGGAYTIANFGKQTQLPASAQYAVAAPRTAVKVEDKDNNGIEDWRDEFTLAEPVILSDSASSTYVLPTTLTGRLGINLFQSIVSARNAGPFGLSQDEVIEQTTDSAFQEVADRIYSTSDVMVMDTWTDEDIKNYANTMGTIILNSKSKSNQNEVYILKDIVERGKTERKQELKQMAVDYKMYRDESLGVPVPKIFLKQHLDLINVYNALYADIEGMSLSAEDPLLTLVRLKRYEDDALGLGFALKNMNDSLLPYGSLFTQSDPAIIFSSFDPNNQSQ